MTAIQLPTGARGARILGLGAYRPRRRVTNHDLAQMMDTNDEWIQSRVGIAERRWASEDETLVEMAVAAGGKAIAASGLAPDEIDLVIVASASLRAPIPGIGPQVAYKLGIPRPGSFDLNAGCAGFCYALGVANDNIRRRLLAQRAGGRGRAAHRRHQPGGPDDGGDLRRRRRCGRGGRLRRAGHRPGGVGQRRRPVQRHRDRRRQLDDDDGRPGGLPLGDDEAHRDPRRGDGEGRRGPGRHRRVRPAPGQPAHRRVDDQAARLPGAAPSSRATSSSRATRRRHPSRWR